MTTLQNQHQIVAGPSREDLFDGLRLRHEGRQIEMSLTTKHAVTMPCSHTKMSFCVDSIGIEDGSGHNWTLQLSYSCGENILSYKAYYNTKTRAGVIYPTQ